MICCMVCFASINAFTTFVCVCCVVANRLNQVLGVVLMTSAILYGMEQGFKDDGGTGAFNERGWQWHDALYFTIVTLSTVG